MKKIIIYVFFTISISFPSTVHVPNDIPTIQLAVNISTQGDTIIVGDGVYTEDVLVNVGVNIISENGPENCFFFNSNNYCGFTLSLDAIISGFWFKEKGRVHFNGSGAVKNSYFTDILENNCNPRFVSATTDSSIDIINCRFIGNDISCSSNVENIGKGLINLLQGYAPTVNIDSCAFINNIFNYSSGQGPNGGAIHMYGGTMSISNSQFILNKIESEGTPKGRGGAIYNYDGDIVIDNCYFLENRAENGSAIYSPNGNLIITNSSIEFNTNNAITLGFEGAPINSMINESNFIQNIYAVLNHSNFVFLNVENNWWGDSFGPYHQIYNISGTGDSVSIYVDILPFYQNPVLSAPLTRVQNVIVETIGTDYVFLNWDRHPAGDVAGYKLYINQGIDGYPFADTLDIGLETSYTILNLISGNQYNAAITCYDSSGNESWYSDNLYIDLSTIGTEERSSISLSFVLHQNYPNPFNPVTTIQYQLPQRSDVQITIFDLEGKEVIELVSETQEAGYQSVIWNASNVPNGMYFYQIIAGDFIQTKKLILLK